MCCRTPGSDTIGCGSVMPSRTNSGAMRSLVRTDVSATRSRRARVRRRRRGRSTGNGAPGIEVMVGRGRRARTPPSRPATRRRGRRARPRAAAAAAVTGPSATTDRRRPRVDRRPPDRRRPAGQHDDVDVTQPGDLVRRRRAHGRAIRRDRLDRVAHGGEPVGEHRPRPVGLGEQHAGRLPRERVEQTLGLGQRRHEVDGASRRGGQRGGRRRADGGEVQRRVAGRGGSGAAGPVRRRHHEPVERGEPGQRLAQGDPAVGRLGDLDERDVDDRRPERGQPRAELAGVGPGDGDAGARERQRPTATRAALAAARARS